MILNIEHGAVKLAYYIALLLSTLHIRANTVTIARFCIAFPLSIYFFTRGTYHANLVGLGMYIFLMFFDFVDGQLAKNFNSKTAIGHFLDLILDRILMLTVTASIFYAGLQTKSSLWFITALVYYSAFFLVTTLFYEFDSMFNLDYSQYPQIKMQLKKRRKSIRFLDRIVYSCLYVHENSLARFCFGASYPLLIGIITNQIRYALLFVAIMYLIRSLVVLFLFFSVILECNPMKREIVNVLKNRLNKFEN